MQAVPRVVSTAPDGGDAREFLQDAFGSPGELASMVFLKGYQWPFDARKVAGGSSLIDILVYIETVVRGRRVYLDYRANPAGFRFERLTDEARQYLANSRALLDTPLARLQAMNPAAVTLYREHGIDLATGPLEVAVCAQHNNGGLAANHWWESVNIRHLFPVGEVNGSHGIYRPGGSALNSGQVGGFRAAEFIAKRYGAWTLDTGLAVAAEQAAVRDARRWSALRGGRHWREERAELQARMSAAGAHVRSRPGLSGAMAEAEAQWKRIATDGCAAAAAEMAEAWTTRQLCFAHLVYLAAVRFAVESGAGSRGSSIVLDSAGTPIHPSLGPEWRLVPADRDFLGQVLETRADPGGTVHNRWVPCRPLPQTDAWFETAWAAHRRGAIYE
jgi:hypothetical protein